MSVYPAPVASAANPTSVERWSFIVLFFGFCSLFTGVQFATPLLIIKPFDLVALLALPPLLLIALGHGALPRSVGLTVIFTFFIMDIASATSVSDKNGAKELIQATELLMFSGVLILYRSELDWDRMARLFVGISTVIVSVTILWHVSNGFYVGWKRLDEPKLLFSYILPVLFGLMLLGRGRAGIYEYLVLGGVGLLILLSGERKALLGFFGCMTILTMVGYVRVIPLALLTWIGAGLVATTLLSSPYLYSQIHSFSTLGAAREISIGELLEPDPELSLSNAQRSFSIRVSQDLIRQAPIFGIGTNAYVPHVSNLYSNYPSFLLVGIHNEFQRILVENGAIGLCIYLIAWIRTAFQGFRVHSQMGSRYWAIYAMFFVVFFLQCFFEGGGNEAFIAYIMMALMPEFFNARIRYRPAV